MSKRRKKLKKWVYVFFLVILLIPVCYFVLRPKYKIIKFENSITVNYNESFKYDDNVCYGNLISCKKVKPKVKGEVNTNELGTYKLTYTFKKNKQELVIDQSVNVKDIEKPTIEIVGEDIIVCPNGKPLNAEVKVTDNLDTEFNDKITYEVEDSTLKVSAKDSAGNKATIEKNVTVKDEEAPKIEINGSKNMTLFIGSQYEEKGATVVDNCDSDLTVTTEGTVDAANAGTYKITYKAKDTAGNEASAERTVTVRQKQAGERVIYLTFDDGPSDYTAGLLDTLKKYDVKATFFVTGKGSDAIIKREHDEGHTVALHTYSHNYSSIYASQEAYFNDLYKIQNRVKNITGETVTLIRFPGGSSNTVSHISMRALTKEVEARGFKYFDWNVSSGDAGGTTTSDGVFNNVTSTLKSGSSVVLQHDVKKFSVDAVERIIQYGQANGYTFLPLDSSSPGMHHGTNH